jgi:putative CocE/NonD family hydrolase
VSPVQRILRHLLRLPSRRFTSESATEWIPLSDGVRLATTVIRPVSDEASPAPVVLIRTPLSTQRASDSSRFFARVIAETGHTVVLQECRGRYASEGRFSPFENEASDGAETLDWIAGQEWGRKPLGLLGLGYSGFAAWAAAALRPERVGALVVGFQPRDPYTSFFSGGAFQLEWALRFGLGLGDREVVAGRRIDFERAVRHRPVCGADRVALRQSDGFRAWVAHPARDEFWQGLCPALPEPAPPALLIAGWYDGALAAQLADYAALRQTARAGGSIPPELLLGPWRGGRPKARGWRARRAVGIGVVIGAAVDFLSRRLRGASARSAPVRVFVEAAEGWRDCADWPPPGAEEQSLHLRGEGRANALVGDGALSLEAPPAGESPDHFVYDPEDPVPTADCFRAGSRADDQRFLEARADVLCYTTDPLPSDLDVIGPVRLILYAATNAPSTDFTAKLVDVAPDGSARGLCEGILRIRPAPAEEASECLEPDTTRKLEIEMAGAGCRFRRGHRVRLEVSSSSFPRFDRNPNTRAKPESAGPESFAASRQTVRHDAAHPSRLLLSVLPAPRVAE